MMPCQHTKYRSILYTSSKFFLILILLAFTLRTIADSPTKAPMRSNTNVDHNGQGDVVLGDKVFNFGSLFDKWPKSIGNNGFFYGAKLSSIQLNIENENKDKVNSPAFVISIRRALNPFISIQSNFGLGLNNGTLVEFNNDNVFVDFDSFSDILLRLQLPIHSKISFFASGGINYTKIKLSRVNFEEEKVSSSNRTLGFGFDAYYSKSIKFEFGYKSTYRSEGYDISILDFGIEHSF